MSKVVRRYALEDTWQQVLELPRGAQLLTLQQRRATQPPDLWALVDEAAVLEPLTLITVYAGQAEPALEQPATRYVGTYTYSGATWHVFAL